MPLITDPVTGAHSFLPDTQANRVQDIDSLNAPRNIRGNVRPLERGSWYEEPLGPAYPGAFYFRWTLNDGRNDFLQDGYLEDYAGERSSGDMVFDRPGIGRLPFKTEIQGAPVPSTFNGDRAYGTNFLNKSLIILPEILSPHLYKDNGSIYTPSIVEVTGFTPQTGAAIPYCMEAVQINGDPALLIGWSTASVQTLQIITDLANPPTSSTVPSSGIYPTYGICQVGIDGNSVQVYTADADGGKIVMFNTNVAVGSATFVDRARLPGGGYTVGLANIGYNPSVYYVVPDNGQVLLGINVGGGFPEPTFRGRLVEVDLRAFEVHDVTIALDFVLYATKTKYGIFYCNGRQHQYLTQGSDFPVNQLEEFGWDASRDRVCRGHWAIDDQIFWRVNETTDGNTLMYTLHFDPVLGTVTSVTNDINLGVPNLQSFGGPRLPYSDLSRDLIDWANGQWYYHHVSRSSEIGWGDRHTSGAAGGAGRPFEDITTFSTPRLRSRNHPGASFVVRRVRGPRLLDLREGGTDATSRVTCDITGHPSVEFRADESSVYVDRRPVAQDIFVGNDSWTNELQATIAAYQGTGGTDGHGTDASRMSGNYVPWTIEGFFFDEPLGPQSIPSLAEMRSWNNGA